MAHIQVITIIACSGGKSEQLRSQKSNDNSVVIPVSPSPSPAVDTAEVHTRCPEKETIGSDLIGDFLSPVEKIVFQRSKSNSASVAFSLKKPASSRCIELRVVDEQSKEVLPWRELKELSPSSSEVFSATITVPQGGWYRLQVKYFSDTAKGLEINSKSFGVGEVFIAAGQSNSANHGAVLQVPSSDRAVSWNGTQWLKASDPQPMASGGAGSPWPPMMDRLIQELGVPVALISVGFGGTRSAEWLPGTKLYLRIQAAVSAVKATGLRAILWHQGEHDTANMVGTAEYMDNLNKIVTQSRVDAGFQVPWLIATVSYIKFRFEFQPAIQQAQASLLSTTSKIFAGPTTDDMLAGFRAKDGVHFSDIGLKEHGSRWAIAILRFISEF